MEADRLSPFKSETPKSRENSRFWASSDYTRHPTFMRIADCLDRNKEKYEGTVERNKRAALLRWNKEKMSV